MVEQIKTHLTIDGGVLSSIVILPPIIPLSAGNDDRFVRGSLFLCRVVIDKHITVDRTQHFLLGTRFLRRIFHLTSSCVPGCQRTKYAFLSLLLLLLHFSC